MYASKEKTQSLRWSFSLLLLKYISNWNVELYFNLPNMLHFKTRRISLFFYSGGGVTGNLLKGRGCQIFLMWMVKGVH